MLEANAAMKSIVRRDTGASWKKYLTRMAKKEGIQNPTAEDLRRMDRKRTDKKVSNDDWKSPSDPDSRIARMKDGRTHLAYKAEHAVDLDSQVVLAATVHTANQSDPQTLLDTVVRAQANLLLSGSKERVQEIVADKGYHAAETLAHCRRLGLRTYIGERKSRHSRRWRDKPNELRDAVYAARRRATGRRSALLHRRRSERVERSFAHICETGAARRTWLRGLESINKRYVVHAAAHNLAVIMRKLFGFGTPRALVALGKAVATHLWTLLRVLLAVLTTLASYCAPRTLIRKRRRFDARRIREDGKQGFPTGC
jgi:hypothetical protein